MLKGASIRFVSARFEHYVEGVAGRVGRIGRLAMVEASCSSRCVTCCFGRRRNSLPLEAGIAACHAIAASYEETDWSHILELYDQLIAINPSPVVALNRAIAISRVHGAEAGIQALEAVRAHPALQRYYLLWATFAKLHAEMGSVARAEADYRMALARTSSSPERRFLESSRASIVAERGG
jgi:predicted RNA polymerase sigma factor